MGIGKKGYYTLGSENLLVLVDHKPLLGLLTTRNLGDIENPRLLHLAERLLRWRFQIQHITGAKNFASDALSRSPSTGPTPEGDYTRFRASSHPNFIRQTHAQNFISQQDQVQSDELKAQVLATTANQRILITSWENLKSSGISDQEYSELLHAVNSQTNEDDWPQEIQEYKRYREHMTSASVDGVVIFKGRAVVPTILRQQVLQALHQAHQGVSGMTLRSQNSVWWPNLSKDIERTQAMCTTCHQNAPSQLPLPSVHPPLPDHPFQLVSSDYFQVEGHTYLIMVDRYSNWPNIKNVGLSQRKTSLKVSENTSAATESPRS